MPSGIVRYFEIDSYGMKSGRPLARTTEPRGTTWRIDEKFSPADEVIKSSGFKDVFASILKNGHEIIC